MDRFYQACEYASYVVLVLFVLAVMYYYPRVVYWTLQVLVVLAQALAEN